MLDVKQLRLPKDLNIPVLVGVGDKDELFTIDKVKELYDLVPGNKKEFLIMKDSTLQKYHLKVGKQLLPGWIRLMRIKSTPHL